MNRLLKVLPLLFLMGCATTRPAVYSDGSVKLKDTDGRPLAVLTIEYAGEPKEFMEGDIVVLKVLQKRGNKIDYGFCIANKKEGKNEDN